VNTLTFDKFSKFDRTEPVAFGIPFAQAELPDPAAFRLVDGDRTIPCQTRVTGSWPDGSVRWLFVRAIVDLPGNAPKAFSFRTDCEGDAPQPEARVTVAEGDGAALDVETGRLSCTIPAEGIWPALDIRLDGRPIWDDDPCAGVRMLFAGAEYDSTGLAISRAVEEDGPLCAVVRIDAELDDDDTVPGIRVRLTFWAGKPWFTMACTVVNRSSELETITEVTDWALEIEPAGESPTLRVACGQYRDQVITSSEHAELHVDADWWRHNTCEHTTDCYAHNSWADWQAERGGILVSLRHATQNFPKSYVAEPDRLAVELYPSEEEDPLEWFAGVAKTHEVLFHLHGPDASDEELGARAAQFQLGDHPRLDPQRFAASGAWTEGFVAGPHSRRVLGKLAGIADARTVGLGVFNFGDDWGPGYTYQGRGESGVDEGDKLVWLNNEYDVTHHYYLMWAVTGERRFLEYGRNSARHWMDVDIIHSDAGPEKKGGHLAHCRRHAAVASVYPSHQWVQGLFDTWHLTGDPDALEAARGVADNVAWQVRNKGYLEPGRASTREMGWALRAMLHAWRETGEPQYRELGEQIEQLFADWGGGGGALLAPYTVHTEPRVNFMNALTGVSLAMWGLATGSARAKQIAVAVADDIIENGMTVFGLPYYKELPSLRRAGAGVMSMQLFAFTHRISGDAKYLDAGRPSLETWLEAGAGTGFTKEPMTNGLYLRPALFPGTSKNFAVSMPAVLEFIAAGGEELAKAYDFGASR
jgi:hypothetical protein